MEPGKTYSLVTAMLDFFGKKPNQSTSEFAQEMKGLNEADRAEIKANLISRGYKIV